MTEILIYTAVCFFLFSMFLTLTYFKREMNAKMMYNDYVVDALDGVYNDFTSNNEYAFTFKKGLAFYRSEDGKISVKSQSKLAGISIDK